MFKICELCGYVLRAGSTHATSCVNYEPRFNLVDNPINVNSNLTMGTITADKITCGTITVNGNVVTSDRTYSYDELKLEIEETYGIPKETRKEEKIMNRSEAEALVAKAAEALAQVEKIETLFGKDDDYKDGDIIYAEIKFLDTRTTEPTKAQLRRYTTYQYAFIKANGYWYSSGPRARGETFTWDRLIAWWSTVYIVKMRNVTKGSFKIKNNQVI